MLKALRLSQGLAVVLAALLAPLTWAQSEALQSATELYAQQEYAAAKSALLEIDVSQLDDEQRARRDALLNEVNDAILGREKATQDAAEAEAAFDAGRWDESETLYQQVANNRYASGAQRDAAGARLAQIEEKRTLAEAAEPVGPIDEAPAEEASEETTVVEATTETPAEEGETETTIIVERTVVTEEAAAEPNAPTAELAPETTGRLTLVDELRAQDELFWNRAMAKMQSLVDEARAHLATADAREDFLAARRAVDAALQQIEANRTYAQPLARYEAAKAQVMQLKQEADAAFDAFQRRKAKEQRQAVVEQHEQRRRLIEEQKQAHIEQLFREVSVLRDQRRYADAAEVLREILEIDAANAQARNALLWAEDFAGIQRQDDDDQAMLLKSIDALEEAREALVPSTHPITYPSNWRDIERKRGGRQLDPTTARRIIDRQLDEVIDRFSLDATTLDLALEYIRERYRVPLYADWRQLEEIDVLRDTLLDPIERENATLRSIIQAVVEQASPFERLGVDVLEDQVMIRPYEQMSVYASMYNIRRLVYVDEDEDDQDTDTFGDLQTGGGGNETDRQEYEEILEEFSDNMIRNVVVGPDNWPLAADIFSVPPAYLVISQTFENHKKIEDFLRTAEGPNSGKGGSGLPQVSYEVRFLTVTHNFLEEIGVDLDFVFNSGSAGYDPAYDPASGPMVDPYTGAQVLMPRTYSRAGFIPIVPALGQALSPGTIPGQPYDQAAFVPVGTPTGGGFSRMTPIPMSSSSASLADPAQLTTGVPGSLADRSSPALSLAGSFLDNLQVDFLIRATQANRRSSIVQAPRILVTEGNDGQISIGRTQDIISELTATPDSDVPNVATEAFDSGASLSVRNVTISGNMRYAMQDITLRIDDDPTLTRFELSRGGVGTSSYFLTLRDFPTRGLRTHASIPDGGTVLLGGFKRVGEVEIDAGVPILSKIPILQRAFTNTSTVKDTQTLLILMKASIILPWEAEEEAFPMFGNAGGPDF